jgi:hypothetical protein
MSSAEVTITGSAVVIGRQHRLLGKNGQDFTLAGITPGGAYFGLVADGCGSNFRLDDFSYPSHNEVGAKLLCQFAAGWLHAELNAATELVPLVERLYAACLDFLRRIMLSIPHADDHVMTQFVATHLLSTLLGFAITEHEAQLFWLGDGYLCHDGNVTSLLSRDEPDYLAYRLLDGALPADSPQAGFNVRKLERIGLQQLAVATDGWTPALLADLQPAPTGLALQRWMNMQARHSGQFDDDGAIALGVLR